MCTVRIVPCDSQVSLRFNSGRGVILRSNKLKRRMDPFLRFNRRMGPTLRFNRRMGPTLRFNLEWVLF